MGDDVARGVKDVALHFIPTEIIIGFIIVVVIFALIKALFSDDNEYE